MKQTASALLFFASLSIHAHSASANSVEQDSPESDGYQEYNVNDGSGGVHIIGDSIFTTSDRRIAKQLEILSSTPIIDHSVGGSVINQIRDQYKGLRSQNVRTVVMDGGGNDILGSRSNCQNQMNDTCKSIIEGVTNVIKDTFEMMKEDGVHQIVFLACHYPMGWNGGFDQSVDYGYEVVKSACENSAVPCLIVDPRQTFKNKSNLFEWDGVHPNYEGTARMAKLIWDEVKDKQIDL